MPVPGFQEISSNSAAELRLRLADRVRLERRRAGLTQKAFAEQCGIPLRTFKRFELGECDSLEAFLRIVVAFERAVALELLFPPKVSVIATVRSPTRAIEKLRARLQK